MHQRLVMAEQSLFLQLIEHGQIAVHHPLRQRQHVFRSVNHGIQRPLHAHPGGNRVPYGQVRIDALLENRQCSIKQLVRRFEPARRFRRIVCDDRHLDLLQVGIGFEQVGIRMPDDAVGGIADGDFLLHRHGKAGIAHRLIHPDERLDDHIHRKVLPLVEL